MENEKKEGKKILIGDKIPDMEVTTTHGKLNIPGHYKGKWFILFSHPGDFTPVCTTEFVAFAKKHEEFKKMNCELIGLSIDQVHSHIKWTEWIKKELKEEIKFPIIADDMGGVSKVLGFIHPGKGTNTVRAVIIADPEGIVRAILYYPQEIGRNIDEFIRMIKAFRVAEKEKAAMPANWPENELVGGNVIIPPAGTEEIAEQRRNTKEFECYDWWFCHKKL